LYLLAVVKSQFERHTEAVKMLGEAIAVDPSSVDSHYLLGQELEGLGRHTEAIVELETDRRASP
jgi:cytochrome c-type biogenesis protein CcmH/NrfG